MENQGAAFRELVELILSGDVATPAALDRAKKLVSVRHGLSRLPRNSDILREAGDDRDAVLAFLQKRPVRTLSGVAVIAAMTTPHPCPHGRCVPCPGGVDSAFGSPQSYTGSEPAALRAAQAGYDPYRQVAGRLEQLRQIGHAVDKAELIVMGGTITARPLDYQQWFVKRCLDAMNDFGASPVASRYLEDAQAANEGAAVRNVAMTFETRPDWCRAVHVDRMLDMGVTKVELGVQSTYDFILRRIERGHAVADSVEANGALRDSALKVGFHMMPGLPGSSFDRDLRVFDALFTDGRFCPDYLKVYPALVVRGTRLHDLWKRGEYTPYTSEEAALLLARIKERLPTWVRLQRIQRDIPAKLIEAGVLQSNVRQMAGEILRREGKRCRCIRCREVGHRAMAGVLADPEAVRLDVAKYEACGGIEHFISYEDPAADALVGFARLRFPGRPHRPELAGAALVRELHVYGRLVPIGERGDDWQHRGFGMGLLRRAEELAREAGYDKLSVMSGVGARPYYGRLGFARDGPFMSRRLRA